MEPTCIWHPSPPFPPQEVDDEPARSSISRGAAGIAAIVATEALVTINDREPKPSGQVLAHNNMVTGTVWVANEDGASLTAIDASQNKVVTTLTGIDGPHNVQVSPDGRSLWVVSGQEAPNVMVDDKTLGLHGMVPTGKMPAHVVVAPDGKTTYATNGADNTVSAIDTTTMKTVATIPVGSGPPRSAAQPGREVGLRRKCRWGDAERHRRHNEPEGRRP